MLNEFSDRSAKGSPKLFVRGEFWLGVFAIFIITALVLGFIL